jgi:hypothetical protein
MGNSALIASLSRALERLAIVGAGVLCVWFGYQLFATVPIGDSTFNLNMGSYVINVTKVGPGIVFAGFGIFLLWRCLTAVVTINGDIAQSTTVDPKPAGVIFGIPSSGSTDPVRLKNDIAVLNAMAASASRTIDQADIERVAHQARVALLAQNWDSAWGDASMLSRLRDGEIPPDGPVNDIYTAQSQYLARVQGEEFR